MSICHVWLGCHHAPEISRREIKELDDIPNFEDEDIVYPCDMHGGEGTDIGLQPGAQLWFVDDTGNEVARFTLDPLVDNGIKYVDGGNAFDESDLSKSYFYFLFVWDKQTWEGPDFEISEDIRPEKLSVKYRRYADKDGDIHLIMNVDSISYAGEEWFFEPYDGDGSEGEEYWVLINGKRREVLPPGKEDD